MFLLQWELPFGIIGALILGQAAVEASIVSPVLIIVVALTGIASFSIPDFSLSFHCRITRFIYILLGAFLGFIGIAVGLFIHLLLLCNLKSFGVPYLAPYGTHLQKNTKFLFVQPMWKKEKRKNYLNTKKEEQQSFISMKWRYPKSPK